MAVVRRTALALSTALIAAATPVAVLSPSLASAAPPSIIDPPAIGACWNATYKQANNSMFKGASVECTTPHTIEIAANLDVPADVAVKGPKSRDLHLFVDARCQVAVNEYAGVEQPTTAGQGTRTWAFWFTPNSKEWKAGNHWVSCAAGSVPKSYTAMRTKPRLVAVSNSIAGSPGRSKALTFTTDYGTGTLVSRKPMTTMAGRPYPGSAGLQKKAWKFCEKTVGSNKYFWYGPSEAEWVAGWTAITCWSTKKST
jgi:hypothetical protein